MGMKQYVLKNNVNIYSLLYTWNRLLEPSYKSQSNIYYNTAERTLKFIEPYRSDEVLGNNNNMPRERKK